MYRFVLCICAMAALALLLPTATAVPSFDNDYTMNLLNADAGTPLEVACYESTESLDCSDDCECDNCDCGKECDCGKSIASTSLGVTYFDSTGDDYTLARWFPGKKLLDFHRARKAVRHERRAARMNC